MIDFRYHLVSIIAIFLALAVGIVLGTTTLNGTVLDDVQRQVKRLTSEKGTQRAEIDELTGRVKGQSSFIARVEPTLVGGVLAGQRVALITAPGVDPAVRTGVQTALRRAEAVITADVRLSGAFVDPKEATALDDLATRLPVAGVDLPPEATGPELAAAELAAVLVSKPGVRPSGAETVQTTLAGFQAGGFLTVPDPPRGSAPLGLVLVPAGPETPDEASAASSKVITELVTRLGRRAVGTLVAGPQTAAEDGGMLNAVRRDRTAAAVASSVDSVELPAGRVAVVLALRAALGGKRGSFGFGPGAASPLPAASPAALPTPAR